MIFFFAISLGWIAFAAGSVLAGASKRRDPPPPTATQGSLTALVMPIYNEDPVRTTSALQAMAEALGAIGANSGFEIVIVSDSTNADAWIRETAAIDRLRARSRHIMPVWYRRRWQERRAQIRQHRGLRHALGRPLRSHDRAGCRQPDRCTHLLRLAQDMQADPALGILQTAPQLIGAQTLFGRLQQFAGCVYGPVITRGLAAWSGDSGNYWGHNAIIRMRAFAEQCGLPNSRAASPSAATSCRTTSSRPRSCAAAAGRCACSPTAAARGRSRRPR
jgi:membrane glycosyltransferase